MKNLPVIVIGSGGHAKVLIEALLLSGIKILGLTDSDPEKHNTNVLGIPVIGGDDMLNEYAPENVMLVNGIGSVKSPKLRRKVFERFRDLDYSFMGVVHPTAYVSKTALIADGVQIMAGACVQTGVVIGSDSIINTGAVIDHDSIIGKHVHIAPGATLSGSVTLEDEVHVGTGASLIQGVCVGAGAVIGAGAAVTENVKERITVGGVPAKLL